MFYGWYIVGVAFLANFMSVGTGFYAFNAFMEPLCDLRSWSRTDINLALVMGTFFGFIGQLIYGTLVMRTGVRILMICGSIAGGLSFILLMHAQTLWQFYLCYILLYLGNGAYGGIVASTAVNNWFQENRGKALGFATAGISFSGAVLPLFALSLILSVGIEGAAWVLGAMILSVTPLALLVVKDWPEQYGLLPDGAPPPQPPENAAGYPPAKKDTGRQPVYWPLPRLLRTGTFWKIGFSYALVMIGTVGVMSQLKPRFSDIGFEDVSAMVMMAATALVGSIGKYVWGLLCDRFDPRKVAAILAGANAAALGLALCRDSFSALVLFITVFGFTMGGILSTYPIMIAHLFGRESFASVIRFVSMFLILQLAGYLIAGQSFDRLGSYDAAYMLFIALDIVAVFLFISIKNPEAGWNN